MIRLKKVKNWFKYHVGKKDITYPNEVFKYLHADSIDFGMMIYLAYYNKDADVYYCLYSKYNQQKDT